MRSAGSTAASLLATVGGLGCLPVAPGTWGSLVGVMLGILGARLASPEGGHPSGWGVALLVATFIIGAVVCTHAERHLGQPDPPAIILDEVWGMAAVIVVLPWTAGSWPFLLVAFLLFRVFDVAKPPPLRHLARLPTGWGIMADDLGAACYAMVLLTVMYARLHWHPHP